MTLKAQEAVCTILVFSVLYAKFPYVKAFVCDHIMIQGSQVKNRRLGRLTLFLFVDWSLY